MIEKLNDISTEGTYPDLTFLLDVPVEVGLGRRRSTEKNDRLDLETKEFHNKVREAYLRLAKANPKRWVIIDGTRTIEAIEVEVWKQVAKKIKAKI